MVQIEHEELVRVKTRARSKWIPGAPAWHTVIDWIKNGARSAFNGKVVCLESIQIGGKRYTTRESLKRFAQELSRRAGGDHGIDPFDPELIPLTELHKLPGKPNYSTACRWVHSGIVNKSTNARVKLAAIQIGGRLYTSRNAYLHFIRMTSEG